MWEPLSRQEIDNCTLVDFWIGPAEKSVFCILDPPKNAIGERSYREAQKNTASVFQRLQQYRESPLPVGLQEEFWVSLEKENGKRPKNFNADDYVEQGGFGIVAAILQSDNRPAVIRLENESAHSNFERLKGRAISYMTESAHFFSALIQGYNWATSRVLSPPLREVRALKNKLNDREITYTDYIKRLIEIAEPYDIEPRLEITLFNKLMQLEVGLNDGLISWERRKLQEEIKARGTKGSINPRAAVELFLHDLLKRDSDDVLIQEQIEGCREFLKEPSVRRVPDAILERVSSEIINPMGEFMAQGVIMTADDQHRLTKGYGDLISRLLEAATVLGIDINKYEGLKKYAYRTNLHFELQKICDHRVSHFISEYTYELESEIVDCLAQEANERSLLEMEPSIEFMSELTQCRIGYGSVAQEVITDFSSERLCELLARLHVPLPSDWRNLARGFDSRFSLVREHNGETIKRGKKICKALSEARDRLKAETVILCCDGYLHEVLASLLAPETSYSFLIPDFSTPSSR